MIHRFQRQYEIAAVDDVENSLCDRQSSGASLGAGRRWD